MIATKVYYLPFDLGITSPSQVVLCDALGDPQSKVKNVPPGPEGYEQALALVPRPSNGESVLVRISFESTGSVWKAAASYFSQRAREPGIHLELYRLKSQDVSQFRKVQHRHAKTNRTDVLSIGKFTATYIKKLHQLHPPPAGFGEVDAAARMHYRLTKDCTRAMLRIKDHLNTAWPGLAEILGDNCYESACARSVLRTFLVPERVLELTPSQLRRRLQSDGADWPKEKVEELRRYATEAKRLRGPWIDFQAIQQNVCELLDEIAAIRRTQEKTEPALRAAVRACDPEDALRSIYGIDWINAAYILASVGNINRFANIDRFVGYTGYYPVVTQTGDADATELRLSGAGPSMLKVALYLAADTARQWDPEFAAYYYRLRVERNKEHKTAICALANKMAGRVYAVLKRSQRQRDLASAQSTNAGLAPAIPMMVAQNGAGAASKTAPNSDAASQPVQEAGYQLRDPDSGEVLAKPAAKDHAKALQAATRAFLEAKKAQAKGQKKNGERTQTRVQKGTASPASQEPAPKEGVAPRGGETTGSMTS